MIEVQENVPLAPLTTFQIGGAAEYFAEVKTEDELREAIRFAREKGIPYVMLSGGSNVLIPDEGL
ncbi:MAG: FAD-binding protein, partial [bacterium]|nr:FAD-binding protein [bacterium]